MASATPAGLRAPGRGKRHLPVATGLAWGGGPRSGAGRPVGLPPARSPSSHLARPRKRTTYQKPDGTVLPIYSNAGVQPGRLIPNFYNGPDLEPYAGISGAFLQAAYFRNADLFASDVISADLSVCEMSFANLPFALLIDAKLSHSTLYAANLTSAVAIRANLSGADLRYVVLYGTNLTDADL